MNSTEPAKTLHSCGTDVLLGQLRKNTLLKAAEDRMNAEILRSTRVNDSGILTLPVVFHIVDNNPDFFSDVQVQAAIDDLNDAFSKSGAYAGSTGADTKIRFCLAKKDPDGGITTGITRTVSFFANNLNPLIEDAKLKNLVQWDPSQYINIWYIRSMHMEIMARFQCGKWLRMYAGGYATMPPGGGPTDGIVVTGLGTMLAHEMGHYLGLYHTFEGLDCRNFNCNTDGDRVCDTPPDASVQNSASCSSPDNSCGTDTLSGLTVDMPDDIANFMDYGNGSCHNKFTAGQRDRMRAAINTQRPGLLVDKCAAPCTDSIVASFTRDNPYPLPGATINFTNNSYGATSYEWIVNGAVVSTSANYSTSFAATGKYKVTLKASNASGCYSTFTHFVIVTCGVTARFYTDKRQIAAMAPKYLDSIKFTNTSVNATSYQWLMANDKGMAEQVISTSANFTYVFTTPANYTVRLIATNGTCTDTTQTYFIPVTDPTMDGTLYLSSVQCYQQTKLRVQFYVCNSGYDGIPKNTPISFYDANPLAPGATKLATIFLADSIPGLCCGYLYTTIIDVGYRGLNNLYGVFNDSGKVVPVVLPNTPMLEKSYTNNIAFFTGFAFKVTVTPPGAVMEWGDSLQLRAQARPGVVSSYVWSTPKDLTCTSCQNPYIVADSTTTKQVVATSNLGCTDTARVTIQVPPYNDFSVEVNDVQCAKQDSIRINFTIKNSYKRPNIYKGLTVAFYQGDPTGSGAVFLPKLFTVPVSVSASSATYTTIVKGMPNGKLYAVVNDSGKVVPLSLPSTHFEEKNYGNNAAAYDYIRYKVTANPSTAVLEWGDTLQLGALGSPGITSSYVWSSIFNMSCSNCQNPYLIADTTIMKRVVGTSALGCTDTAYVDIQVPPYNDFTVAINDAQCARGDSMFVNFTVRNSFRRGVIPGKLAVSFYNGDPRNAGAVLLPPVLNIPDTIFARQATFNRFIKGMSAGNLYAVVHDSGKTAPIAFPNIYSLEKDYTNNVTLLAYQPEKLVIRPADTTVFRKQIVPLQIGTTIYNPASTLWGSGANYTLSCVSCDSTNITVFQSVTVPVQTENRYGCVLKGSANVKIFPPDFTVKVLETKCYTNNTARVTFSVCMNNGYDSVWKGIPVAFYDGDPGAGSAKLLQPIFRTPELANDSCATYTTIVDAPLSNKLAAVVNDKGGAPGSTPDQEFNETDDRNNIDTIAYTPFTVRLYPSDTAISKWSSVELVPQADGGQLTKYFWSPAQYLSCGHCDVPVAAPPHTTTFQLLGRNEFYCTDTALSVVRTYTSEGVYIPSAFTPNGDGKNDIFYVLSGPEVTKVKSFAVYNRWGQMVFSAQNFPANSPVHGWDGKVAGKEAPSQAFVYQVTIVLKDGKEKLYKGTVTLVR